MSQFKNDKKYYLARAGRAHGPLDQAELERLRDSGDYGKYTWFWDPARPSWQAIDPPPPPPLPTPTPTQAQPQVQPPAPIVPASRPSTQTSHENSAAPAATESWPTARPVTRADQLSPGWIDVLGIHNSGMLTGRLQRVTDGGCELVTAPNQTRPTIATGSSMILNLVDRRGRSMNVRARVSEILHQDGAWTLLLNWRRTPLILEEIQAPGRHTATVSNPAP